MSVWRLKERYLKTWRNSFYTWKHRAHPKNKRFDYKKIVSDYKLFKGTPFGSFRDDCKDYRGYNPSHSTVYNALSTSGFVSPRAYIPVREKRHLPRLERPNEGDLIQIDASCHDWFMNGQEIALHEAIDDATHKIVGLYFCANECLLGYYQLLTQVMCSTGGLPSAIYSDRDSYRFAFIEENRRDLLRVCSRQT